MGGAFLSKPITTKNTCVIQHSKIRVITSEMQGKIIIIKAGENTWKMPFFFIVSLKKSFSLPSSMVMEVQKYHNTVHGILSHSYKTIKTSSKLTTPKLYSKPSKPSINSLIHNKQNDSSSKSVKNMNCNPSQVVVK